MEREVAVAKRRSDVEDWMSLREGFVLAYSGHFQQARAKGRRAVQLAQQSGQLGRAAVFGTAAALWEAFAGNAAAARQDALAVLKLSKDRDVEFGAAFALALAGDFAQSQTLVTDLEQRFPEDTSVKFSYVPPVRAILALSHGDPARAIDALQLGVRYELDPPLSIALGFYGALYGVYARGQAYLAAHQGAEAAAEFQKILDHRTIVVSDPMGAIAHLQLGRALVLTGDKAKAKAAYQDFLTLWKDADPDIPILKTAKEEFAKL